MDKIVITTTSFGKCDTNSLKLLEKNGFEIVLNPYGRKLEKDETISLCKDAIGIIAGTETLDAEVLGILVHISVSSPQFSLKVISRCGTGLDNIDLKAAERLGIKVFNTPDVLTLPVAELTIGLILNLLRKINNMDMSIKKGRWEKEMGNLLSKKKVGIVGFGRIGKKVAELVKPFGCEVKYYDIRTEELGLGVKRIGLDEIIKTSDIISIHVSSKEKIIGENEIRQMKEGAWLVNVSRGGVVDEDPLYHALKEGRLAGAALDVFAQEPYRGHLRDLDNVILTPHIGSYAKEARVEMEMQATKNLLMGLGISA